MLTQEHLKEILNYDPISGKFVWYKWRLTSKGSMKLAGCVENGYLRIKIDGKKYLAHRLAWLYMTGKFPVYEIDHIDRSKMNNQFSNLRDVSHAHNIQNVLSPQSNNKVGLLGVHKVRDKYRSSIRVDGVLIHLGYFDNKYEAHLRYLHEKKRLHIGLVL